MKRRIIAALLAGLMLLGLLSGCSKPEPEPTDAPETETPTEPLPEEEIELFPEVEMALPNLLTVGDVQVVADGELKQESGEGWQYDGASNTLTLEGAAITGHKENANGICGLYCDGDLNILLVGENSVDNAAASTEGSASGVFATGQLYISGEGSLTVRSGDAAGDSVGIYALTNLVVAESTVRAEGGSGMRSFGMACRDGISIDPNAAVEAVGGSAKALSAGLYSGQGSIWISDATVSATGGEVTWDPALTQEERYVESGGIWAQGSVAVFNSAVTAIGGTVDAADTLIAFSSGIFTCAGLDADYETQLTAQGGSARGTEAYSRGAYGREGAVQVYVATAAFTGGEATGVTMAGSYGVQTYWAGFYTYDSGANVTLTAGSATATAAEGIAQANGFRAYAGDAGIDLGTVVITGGTWSGASGDGCGMFLEADVEEDSATGGYVTLGSEAFVTVTSQTCHGIRSHMDISAQILQPEGGSVEYVSGEGMFPEYCFVADAEGNPAKTVVAGTMQ